MNLGAVIGITTGLGILAVASILSSSGAGVPITMLGDIVSFLIVVGGTLSATSIAFPLEDVIGAIKGFGKVFGTQGFTYKDVVMDYVNLAEVARKGELTKALDGVPEHMPFRLGSIKDGMSMIIDGYSQNDMREIMENKEEYRSLREIKRADALQKMGDYAPSFGMIGTLIGLVFMLGGMGQPTPAGVDPAAQLASSMAVALITTLYGSLFAFLFFIPFADHLKYINEWKKVESALHIEGSLMLAKKIHPIMVRDKLNAFLARKDRLTNEE